MYVCMCYKWAHTMSFKSTHIKFFPFPFPFSSTETHFVVIIFYECALLFGAYCFWLYSKCIYVHSYQVSMTFVSYSCAIFVWRPHPNVCKAWLALVGLYCHCPRYLDYCFCSNSSFNNFWNKSVLTITTDTLALKL